MEKSPSIVNIAKALRQFHSIMGKIPKDATNPFFNSRYCTLSTILEFIKEPLQESGLSFTQFPCGVNSLVTVLMHESGEYMQSEFTIQPIKNDPQAQGSVISYMRRYGLAAILGLNLDDDNTAPATNSSAKNIDSDKQWLDKNSKKYDLIVERLKSKSTTLSQVTQYFKLNKEVRAELQSIINEAGTGTAMDNEQ